MRPDGAVSAYDGGWLAAKKEQDYDPEACPQVYEVRQEIARLREAVVEAHRIILHEMDNGRTPSLLQAKNGGKGLGYFEDILSGVKR
jgi:hypothetical protein